MVQYQLNSPEESFMPTIEERVQVLEAGFTELKARAEATEFETQNIADLVKIEHRFTNSKVDRLEHRMDTFERRMTSLECKVDALPRVLAEMLKGQPPQS
jgi:predicted RNase H-like nuclease (RuvC/YqgF family)